MIIMSAPVQRFGFLGFSDLVWTFGPVGTGDLGLGLGLDNNIHPYAETGYDNKCKYMHFEN